MLVSQLKPLNAWLMSFEDPNPDLGDFFASLKGQSAGDLIHVKTNTEEVRISIW